MICDATQMRWGFRLKGAREGLGVPLQRTNTNCYVRICHISNLQLQNTFGLRIVVLPATDLLAVASAREDSSMSNRLANYLIAGELASALAVASPSLAFRGGGG